MDIVVKGRHTAVSEGFRRHVQTKLAKLERLDSRVMRVDVELSKESNPRLSDMCDRVELTVYSRGPVIRAEAAAGDSYAALDRATAKLAERLRRAADRRVRHHANHAGANHPGPGRAGSLTADLSLVPDVLVPDGSVLNSGNGQPAAASERAAPEPEAAPVAQEWASSNGRSGTERVEEVEYSPMVVREKTHVAAPMTLDDALSNMELVGHDFYLFLDARSGLPSVVYRRCGYDYGVIRLTGAASRNGADGMDGTREPASAVISAV
ncbi:ribosomal subunit interface protein [Parafrankia colletiae]|uniref:Ribosome hibernation promoting factor n=1 Tax=Parafrankia colletiae TaxID=573497 RepID=A0A1S1Q5K9_9ACTN|nr:ribosome-associated translation inhibitor RaiA [Parafrankia colletiae]MCK9903974.1 ribosome-associated translation inhibitor RaiA [Frankia sp. Cpl3]OHV28887.1 ribosomal subunit interface protein [Parafrankia colletiae]